MHIRRSSSVTLKKEIKKIIWKKVVFFYRKVTEIVSIASFTGISIFAMVAMIDTVVASVSGYI